MYVLHMLGVGQGQGSGWRISSPSLDENPLLSLPISHLYGDFPPNCY